jgi:hypothetical protein
MEDRSGPGILDFRLPIEELGSRIVGRSVTLLI